MDESTDSPSLRIQDLTSAVDDLRRRVTYLERAAGIETGAERAAPVRIAVGSGGEAAMDQAGSLAPLFGWSLLGISGAYLLRALTESGAVPGIVGAMIGIAYAAYWLYLASRKALEKPIFSAVHGLTAALILTPMVYETTVRFHLISLPVASVIVIFFAVLGLGIGWKRNVTAIAWIATISGLLTATALFRETHDAITWVATVLAIALAVEISACRDHWLSLRWIVAMSADFTVLVITVLALRSNGPAPNLVLGAQIALLTIYLASTVDRTIFRGLSISWFEIGQAAVAFLVSIGGALQLAELTRVGPTSVGLFCVFGGVACYLVSFAFLDRHSGHDRNFYTYSTFGLLLITAGGSVLLSGVALAAAWSSLAVVMIAAGFTRGRDTLRLHGAVYLVLGIASAKLLQLATERIIRTNMDIRPDVSAAYILMLAGVLLCYLAVLKWGGREEKPWADTAEAILIAAVLCWGIPGILSGWISAAPLRTALLTATAIIVGWAGGKWHRFELTWLAYPLLALAGLKLIAEDFQQGHSITLFASLIFFGGGLIVLPRLMRK